MYQISYVSTAVHPMSVEELTALLDEARTRNMRYDVTGMLVYRDQRFLQVIEGSEADVQAIYDLICQDRRHEGVTQLMARPTPEREFEDWSMGFHDASGNDLTAVPGFRPLERLTDPTLVENPGFAHRVLLYFQDLSSV